MLERFESPLFAIPVSEPAKARELSCERCSVDHARELIRLWHSRLPKTQRGPWMFAFRGAVDDYSYAVALWNNPSARTLPQHWIELRRMAVSPDAPHCTASWFLGAMAKWFRDNAPQHEVMISYQDEAVHEGTIYKAAGWIAEHRTAARMRDRSKPRPNGRIYRRKVHGIDVDASAKIRWQKSLNSKTTILAAEQLNLLQAIE